MDVEISIRDQQADLHLQGPGLRERDDPGVPDGRGLRLRPLPGRGQVGPQAQVAGGAEPGKAYLAC